MRGRVRERERGGEREGGMVAESGLKGGRGGSVGEGVWGGGLWGGRTCGEGDRSKVYEVKE